MKVSKKNSTPLSEWNSWLMPYNLVGDTTNVSKISFQRALISRSPLTVVKSMSTQSYNVTQFLQSENLRNDGLYIVSFLVFFSTLTYCLLVYYHSSRMSG